MRRGVGVSALPVCFWVRCDILLLFLASTYFFSGCKHVCFESIQVSGKLPTYPSPKPSFCPKREVSVNANLGEG